MLTYEWRELETLCDRISDLRHRYAAAQRSKNVGLIEGLKDDIVRAQRQRELLVQHISASLGAAAAERSSPSKPLGQEIEPATTATGGATEQDEAPGVLA